MKRTMQACTALLLVFACGIAAAQPVDTEADFGAFLDLLPDAHDGVL